MDEWETTNPNPPFSSRIGRRPGHENRKATTVVGHDTYFPNSSTTTATYDALGRMVEKGVSGTYTQFVYNPDGTSLAVYSGGLTKGTISLPGGSTAVYNASGLNFIRHKDWLGSSRLATTWAHAVYSKEAYAPFGETYNEAGTADRSFTGQDQNVVTNSGGTGVYDYLFRKYDPSAGRWLSPDPAGWGAVNQASPQSLNRYAYVENQPMSLVDPTGLACMYAMSDGSVSVSNFGGDSGAEGVCEANGGTYTDGYVDPTAVSLVLPGDTLPGAGYQGQAEGAGEILIASGNGATTIMQANSLTLTDLSYLFSGLNFQSSNIPSGTAPTPGAPGTSGNPTQVEKLICQQQAKAFQAQYNAAQSSTYNKNWMGVGAGVKGTWMSVMLGFAYPYAMNKGQSDSAYTIGYEACEAGGFPAAQ